MSSPINLQMVKRPEHTLRLAVAGVQLHIVSTCRLRPHETGLLVETVFPARDGLLQGRCPQAAAFVGRVQDTVDPGVAPS